MHIICPNCKHQFLLDQAIEKERELQLREAIALEEQHKFEAQRAKDREEMLQFKANNELAAKAAIAKQLEELQAKEKQIKQQLESENKIKLEFLQQQADAKDKQLAEAQKFETQALQLKQQLLEADRSRELELKNALIKAEAELAAKAELQANERAEAAYLMKLRERDTIIENQRRQVEEQNRKLNQQSMELQGEVQEDYIKETLQRLFPFDVIEDVAKGRSGADLVHTVRNSKGQKCGTIIYESKNAKSWSKEWVDKLMQDRQRVSADVSVLVTQAMPANIKHIGQEKDVWVCGLREFEGVAFMLRDAIIKLHEAKGAQENKGDKMVMLYEYLNSNDFRQKWDSIRDGFIAMKTSIEKQRSFYIKTLAEQEQIANRILINANQFLGDIQGISGAALDDVKMIE
jgi:hypothetical protein